MTEAGTSSARGWNLATPPRCNPGWRRIRPPLERVSALEVMPFGPARRSVPRMSTEPAAIVALTTLRRARAQQEATHRWIRRLAPPLFVVVAVAVFSSGRNPGIPGRDVAAVLAVGGFALRALGALTARYRRAAARIIFAVMLLASSATLVRLQPDGPGLARLLAGLVLLAPRGPDRFPIALTVAGLTWLAAGAGGVSHDSPTVALLRAIAARGVPGLRLVGTERVAA